MTTSPKPFTRTKHSKYPFLAIVRTSSGDVLYKYIGDYGKFVLPVSTVREEGEYLPIFSFGGVDYRLFEINNFIDKDNGLHYQIYSVKPFFTEEE